MPQIIEIIAGASLGIALVASTAFRVQDSKNSREVAECSPIAFLLGFLVPDAIGAMASSSRGTIMYQLHGGRDPEYETEIVRKVSVQERLDAFYVTSHTFWIPLLASSIVAYFLIPRLSTTTFGQKLGTSESRITFLILSVFLFFVIISGIVRKP